MLPALFRTASDAVLGPSGEIVSKAAVSAMGVDGWWQFRPVHEPWSGAFQQGYEPQQQNVLAFSAVYACVSLIANDIAKLRPKLMEIDRSTRIWAEVENSAFSPVLRKPNRYQTRIQFFVQWLASKLLAGNAYVLKERDARRVVTDVYVLNPHRVKTLVSESGAVYYDLGADELSGMGDNTIVPASEIIHDRMLTPYHPLCGLSPIYACGMSAMQGARIQSNSSRHFENQSRPGGVATAPGKISDETAARIKQQIEMATSGVNVGRLIVLGDGLKYEQIGMTAVDSQLIEQLAWTVEDVARAFLVPLSKLSPPANATGKSTAQEDLYYYKQTLQRHIEDIELLLDEGLGLGPGYGNAYGVELDLEGLLRMDPETRARTGREWISAGVVSPNEARFSENLPPVKGGESPYLQQQNYSLEALAKRDAGADPFGAAAPAPTPPDGPDDDSADKALYLLNRKAPEELLHAA